MLINVDVITVLSVSVALARALKMDCQGINFANISKIIVPNHVEYTTFPFVLKMLLELVQHSFKRHFMFAEGK